ncbi:RAB6-interacting golgin isoform X2 [Ictalurus punctatus]|uniref:RAB6-interacting golgin n=1 Tax=Ictalurus punctatus TaxID=7998 RepID=A0A2D0Q089_ICTPU|nr:RAB6-interacting golgin isoform X2 [Ictalurus punctatus]
MASWAGFSEEELRRMQQKDESVGASFGRGRRSAPTNRSRQQLQREKALQMAAKHKAALSGSAISPEQQLQPSTPPAPCQTNPDKVPKQELQQAEPEPGPLDSEDPPSAVKELDKQEVELREKTRLENLQWEQRVMEEKNKRTKALLTKTIAEKSKQTQAEAVKLKKIQKELQALDDSVSSDIGVLRRLIEQASLEYSIAWKRLEKAETEYVAAKLDLHKKTEVKEQLTEHLCAIIQQNELRKARKLEELMLQLELSTEHASQGAHEEVCGERESPGHPATVNETKVKSDEQIQTDCVDISVTSDVTVTRTSEGQERELLTATASDKG